MNPNPKFDVELVRTDPTEKDYLNDVVVKVNGATIHLTALLVYKTKGRQQADTLGWAPSRPRLTFRLKFDDPTIRRNKDFPELAKAIRAALLHHI